MQNLLKCDKKVYKIMQNVQSRISLDLNLILKSYHQRIINTFDKFNVPKAYFTQTFFMDETNYNGSTDIGL